MKYGYKNMRKRVDHNEAELKTLNKLKSYKKKVKWNTERN